LQTSTASPERTTAQLCWGIPHQISDPWWCKITATMPTENC
jgi:hypothetical protein